MVCVVPGCRSKRPYVRLFSVPRSDIIRALWMEYLVPLRPSLKNLVKEQLLQYQVCILHFEPKYVERGLRKFRSGPTLFTPEEIKTQVPTRPFPVLVGSKDHTYCKEAHDDVVDLLNDHNYYFRGEPPQFTAPNALDGSSEADEIPMLLRQVYQIEYPGIELDEPDDPLPVMPEVECPNEYGLKMYDDNTKNNDGYISDNDNDDGDHDDNEAEHTSESEHVLDEVDTLFISYAASFRKLSANLQRILKLDLAKLFARYEMKNLILEESRDKENRYKTKLADKNTYKKVTKGFANQPKRIFKTPEEPKLKPPLKRPAPPFKAARPASRDVTSVKPGNPKSALSKFLKFPKTNQTQSNSNQAQSPSPSHSITSEFYDKPCESLRLSPLLDDDKYFSDWEQVSDDDPIVEKVMLPSNWSAKDVFIIPEDDAPD